MGRFLGKITNRLRRLSGKMEQYQEAVTFAEAGQQQRALGIIQEKEVEEKPPKLLVVGRESTFSKQIIDYALEMAQRMSYEILALNTAPLSCETFKLFSSSRNKVCQDFQALSEENLKPFREAAESMGICFSHVVRFSEREEALEEIIREFKNIEFVISDAEGEEGVERAEEGERPRQAIYVYSVV